jgi:hypothetical protein
MPTDAELAAQADMVASASPKVAPVAGDAVGVNRAGKNCPSF